MDTHILPTLDPADDRSAPTARLPGEPDLDAGAAHSQPAPDNLDQQSVPPVPSRKRRRPSLLAGVALTALITAGAGAFILSPYNHVIPVSAGARTQVQHLAAKVGVNLDEPPLAPSASLARVEVANRPATVTAPSYTPKPADEGLRELLAMQQRAVTSPTAAPARPAVATPPAVAPDSSGRPAELGRIQEPGGAAPASAAALQPMPSTPAAPASAAAHPDITGAVTAAALAQASPPSPAATTAHPANAVASPPVSPEPGGVTSTAPAPSTADRALAQLENLRAAPMTDTEQVQVLQAVTEIATLVKDLRTQDAALRADYTKQLAEAQARLADFERRINLAEARAAIRSASAPVDTASASGLPPTTGPASGEPVMVRQISATAPVPATSIAASPASVAPKRYRVRAASPGLAMLAEEARGGGDGAQIQVAVGDVVPGWGVVKSVAQKGSSWVVNTEHGVIE